MHRKDNSNYLDVYFSRVNFLGENMAERVQKAGELEFNKTLEASPHTVRGLSVERGIHFNGIILTNKDKEYQKFMKLNVANDIPIVVGDIVNWNNEEGRPEKWLIFSREKKVNGAYQTFQILRCNYLIRWVNGLGHIEESWAYVLSSIDSQIKGNFRTWNSLITPQPNKQAEFILPRHEIARSTTFILEEEAWSVVEYDHTSVPGIVYISLTEDKINSLYDDVEGHLADTHKIADYQLALPEGIQHFMVGAPITPTFTLMKNGFLCNEPTILLPTDKHFIKVVDGQLIARNAGKTKILVQLVNYPEIQIELEIEIGEAEQEFDAYIDGRDKIMLDRICDYKLIGTAAISEPVTFTLDETELAELLPTTNSNLCQIHANDKNELGYITLRAQYLDKEYEKTIAIIPLW